MGFPKNRMPGKQPGDPKDLPPPEVIRGCGMIFGGGSFIMFLIFLLLGGSDTNILMAIISMIILVMYYRMDLTKNGDPKK